MHVSQRVHFGFLKGTLGYIVYYLMLLIRAKIRAGRTDWKSKKRFCGRDDLFFALHMIWVENCTSADAMTFFWSLLDLGEKLHTSADAITFFSSSHDLGGKLDFCGRENLQRTCPPVALKVVLSRGAKISFEITDGSDF